MVTLRHDKRFPSKNECQQDRSPRDTARILPSAMDAGQAIPDSKTIFYSHYFDFKIHNSFLNAEPREAHMPLWKIFNFCPPPLSCCHNINVIKTIVNGRLPQAMLLMADLQSRSHLMAELCSKSHLMPTLTPLPGLIGKRANRDCLIRFWLMVGEKASRA